MIMNAMHTASPSITSDVTSLKTKPVLPPVPRAVRVRAAASVGAGGLDAVRGLARCDPLRATYPTGTSWQCQRRR